MITLRGDGGRRDGAGDGALPALAAVVACCGPRATAEAAAWAAHLTSEREHLVRRLSELSGLTVTPGARASFILITRPSLPGTARTAGAACGPTVRERLRQAGFAVRRGDTFPGLGPGWLRIAVRDRATNDRFVAALARVLDAISKETP